MVGGVGFDDSRHLGAARRAPGSPEVDKGIAVLADIVANGDVVALDARQTEVDVLAAYRGAFSG